MLKVIFYLTLTSCGVIGTFFNPLIGAVACLLAYLLNPAVFEADLDLIIRYQLIVTVAFFVSLLIYRPRGLSRCGREAIVLYAIWIYIGIAALSSQWAVISDQTALDSIFELFKTVLLISALLKVVRTEGDVSVVIMACLIGISHAAFLHIFGVRWGYLSNSYSRFASIVPDAQTGVLVLFVPSMLLLAMTGTRLERILAWCSLPIVLDSIVETYERTGFVALSVELVLIFLFVPRRFTFRLLPALVVGVGLFVFRFTPDDYWERMGTIRNPTEEASANSRLVVNEASNRMWLDYPLFGVGYGNYPYVSPRYLRAEYLSQGKRSAHNSYYAILCETGIVGFGVWIFSFLGTFFLLRKIRINADKHRLTKLEIYAVGLEIGLYGWLVGGWFQSYHEVDPAYWFIALAIVLTRLNHGIRQADSESLEVVPLTSPAVAVQSA